MNWTRKPEDIQATIDLHLRFRHNRFGRDEAIEDLALQLGRTPSAVGAAVDAVVRVDAECSDGWHRPSTLLKALWDERGLPRKV
ncbi:hypothetical protein HPC49_23915 [Pyxidicoccus fallax]|uniref:Uncharacterized protein n=1 Tax=Pyxidicoccus fallax TaxID=394095 RepID=A0A848LQE9_9BACT|nr:hypothetical protein [Pyxidicoccus fallax]NMO19704.1 hypothetical protein [Pyxidicoccus fallax]NPC81263.1 hypothetical protein [Pyxidicoccus fallax]